MVNGQEKPSESMLNRETLQNMKLPLLPNLPSSLSTETTHRHLLSPPARNSRKRPHRQGNKSCAASLEQWPHHGVLLGNHMQSMTFIRLENQWRKQYDGHISQFSFEPYRTWDAAEAGQGIRAKGLLPHIPAGLDWKPASFYLLTAKESSQILGWKAFCFRGECELKCVCGCRKAKKKSNRMRGKENNAINFSRFILQMPHYTKVRKASGKLLCIFVVPIPETALSRHTICNISLSQQLWSYYICSLHTVLDILLPNGSCKIERVHRTVTVIR